MNILKLENKRIISVLIVFSSLFIGLVGYMSYFQVFRAQKIKYNSYNKRLWINEEYVVRGSILDRNGRVLAYSERQGEDIRRYYKYGRLYSHIIGYSFREYGKAGLELTYNNQLLNINENSAIHEFINIVAPPTVGNNLELTIDHGLQEKTRSLLQGKKGAVVSMNPKTGEIYSMVSLPDFDVSRLKEDWNDITDDPNSPFVNRAIQGLYPPGSTFKIITTVGALNTNNLNLEYDCVGSVNVHGYTFSDYQGKAHGNLDLMNALVYSCNTYFTSKSSDIGKETIGQVAEGFMFNNKIPFDLPVKTSLFPRRDNIDKTELAAASIGQGRVLATPLNMLLVASGIANNGEIVQPYLVKNIISKDGKVLRTTRAETLSRGTDTIIANEVKDMMVGVIRYGTGTNGSIRNVQVAGKTGTAENQSGKSHAWFVGFAPADDPKIAVAVVLEEEGSTGGRSAAPIARDLIIYALNNINF